jgi:uncharacterized OB-fold protein
MSVKRGVKMYCVNCGNKLFEGVKFCSQCGNVVDSYKTKVQAQTQSQSQTFIKPDFVMTTSKKEGILKATICYLIFYRDSIVLAHLSKERQKDETKKFQEKIKAEGNGFLKRTMIMANFPDEYGERYYNMQTDDILNEDHSNHKIDNDQIQKIVFKAASTFTGSDGSYTKRREGEVIIHCPANKLKFTHRYRDSDNNIKEILTAIYGAKLKYTKQLWR